MGVSIMRPRFRRAGGTAGRMGALVLAAAGALWGLCAPALAGRFEDAVLDYRRGEYTEAAITFEKLAGEGDVRAQFWLGTMWYQGRGKPKNFTEAVRWYRQAAYLGNAEAQNNLGLIYRNGESLPPSPVVAYAWFALSAAQNNEVAGRNLSDLTDTMSPEQVLQGQQLTQEYLARIEAEKRRGSRVAVTAGRMPSLGVGVGAGAGARDGDGASSAFTSAPVSAQGAFPYVPPSYGVSARTAAGPAIGPRGELGQRPEGRPPLDSARVAGGSEVFMVQLGIFQNPDGIRSLRSKLQQSKLRAEEVTVNIRGREFQRFRVGPFPTAVKALAVADRLNQSFGVQSAVIPMLR